MPRRFVITVITDFPGGEAAARKAGEKTATEIGWGDNNTTSIEVIEYDDGPGQVYLAGWEMEPGDDED